MKKPRNDRRQPPTDDQILKRMKRDGVPPPPEPAWRDRGAPCVRTAVEPSQLYPKKCSPVSDRSLARDAEAAARWKSHEYDCFRLGYAVLDMLPRKKAARWVGLIDGVVSAAKRALESRDKL